MERKHITHMFYTSGDPASLRVYASYGMQKESSAGSRGLSTAFIRGRRLFEHLGLALLSLRGPPINPFYSPHAPAATLCATWGLQACTARGVDDYVGLC